MRYFIIIFLVLFGNKCVDSIPESCDENGELSFREKILLFPLSVTHDLCAAKHLAESCNVAFEADTVALEAGDDVNTDTDTDAASDGGDNEIDGNLKIGVECDTEVLTPPFWLRVADHYVSVIADIVTNVPEYITEMQDVWESFATDEMLATLQTGLYSTLGQFKWPDSHADLVRYALALLLAMSLVPLVVWTENHTVAKSEDNDRKTIVSKRSLETNVGLDPCSLSGICTRKLSPVLEQSKEGSLGPRRRRPKRNCLLRSFKDESRSHYLMCEYYDNLPCNCGGRAPSLVWPKHIFKVINTSPIKQNPISKINIKNVSPPKNIVNNTESEIVQIEPDLATNEIQKSHEVHSTDILPCHVVDIETSGRTTPSHEEKPTIELYENKTGEAGLDMSFASDIGDPCFNSSFKEDFKEDLYIIKDPVDVRAIGDGPCALGPPLIVTRRSPAKEMGISLEESFSFSQLDESFMEDDCDEMDMSVEDVQDDSLLDASYLNKSLSFSGGDGILEFAVLFIVQRMYKWTKSFLRDTKRLQQGDISSWSQNTSSTVNSHIKDNYSPRKIKLNPPCNSSLNAKGSTAIQCHSFTDSSCFESAGNSFTDKRYYMLSRGDGPPLDVRATKADLEDTSLTLPKREKSPKKSLFTECNTFQTIAPFNTNGDVRAQSQPTHDSSPRKVGASDQNCLDNKLDLDSEEIVSIRNVTNEMISDVYVECMESQGNNQEVIDDGYLPDDDDLPGVDIIPELNEFMNLSHVSEVDEIEKNDIDFQPDKRDITGDNFQVSERQVLEKKAQLLDELFKNITDGGNKRKERRVRIRTEVETRLTDDQKNEIVNILMKLTKGKDYSSDAVEVASESSDESEFAAEAQDVLENLIKLSDASFQTASVNSPTKVQDDNAGVQQRQPDTEEVNNNNVTAAEIVSQPSDKLVDACLTDSEKKSNSDTDDVD